LREEDRALLRQSILFRDLPADGLARVCENAFMQTLPKGALLFEQGTMPEVLHVILSGRVALMGELPEEAAAVVEFFNAGDALIVPAVVLDLEYLLSAQVVAEARILMIQVALFRHCLNTDIALAAAATRLLSVHWRRLIEQIKHLKLLSATRRLAAYLLGNAPMESGSARFRFTEERRLLATRLGMTPESLSRAFARLREQGVATEGAWIEIRDAARLRAYVDSGGTVSPEAPAKSPGRA